MKQLTLTDIEYSNRKKKTKREEFLDAMEEIIPWKYWADMIRPFYFNNTRGRKPIGIETMLRMYKCDYHKQWGQDIVNDAVAELIKKMVTSPDFEKGIREKIAARVDTSELEQELDGLKKKMRQLEVSKDKIAIQMDNLDVTDSMYEKKYDDLQKRFYDKYDEMALTENHMDEIQSRLAHIRRKQLSGDRIYNFLIAVDKLYDKLSDAEKKEFMGTFVESIELYPERLENGKFLKHIHFRFPVYYNGTVIDDISWENGSTVETVCLMSRVEGK